MSRLLLILVAAANLAPPAIMASEVLVRRSDRPPRTACIASSSPSSITQAHEVRE